MAEAPPIANAARYRITLDRTSTSFSKLLFEFLKQLHIDADNPLSFLKYHQQIVRAFITSVDVKSRGLLVYHLMGTGKSIVGATVAMEMIGSRQPIVLINKSLEANFRANLIKYISLRRRSDRAFARRMHNVDAADYVQEKFAFVTMNAANVVDQLVRVPLATKSKVTTGDSAAAKALSDADDEERRLSSLVAMGALDNKLLIVEEAHNLFRAITNGSKNGLRLYDMIMKARNLRLLFLTGTPISTDPFELVPCFNMLSGENLLPDSYADFYRYFVDRASNKIINRAKLANRLLGMVSYTTHLSRPIDQSVVVTPTEFPTELPMRLEIVPMAYEQYSLYQLARDKEQDEQQGRFAQSNTPAMQKPRDGGTSSSYRQRSRQISNYAPTKRFRDVKFSAIDIEAIDRRDIGSTKIQRLIENIDAVEGTGLVYSQFVSAGGLGMVDRSLRDAGWHRWSEAVQPKQPTGGQMTRAQRHYASLHGRQNIAQAAAAEDQTHLVKCGHSSLWFFEFSGDITILEVTGSKMALMTLLEAAVRSVAKRTRVRSMHWPSVQSYKQYTQQGAIVVAQEDDNHVCLQWPIEMWLPRTVAGSSDKAPVFARIAGDVSFETRNRIVQVFNSKENIDGSLIRMLLVSSTGAEGLNLKNCRHVHVLEPYWNIARIRQIVARAVRNDSHKDLPVDKRIVQPFLYMASRPSDKPAVVEAAIVRAVQAAESPAFADVATTDLELYVEAMKTGRLLDSFMELLQDVSIECALNGGKHCHMCAVTDQPLYNQSADGIRRDIANADPCQPAVEVVMKAASVEHDGKTYYYAPDAEEGGLGWTIFTYDAKVAAYTTAKLAPDVLMAVFEKIEAANIS